MDVPHSGLTKQLVMRQAILQVIDVYQFCPKAYSSEIAVKVSVLSVIWEGRDNFLPYSSPETIGRRSPRRYRTKSIASTTRDTVLTAINARNQ